MTASKPAKTTLTRKRGAAIAHLNEDTPITDAFHIVGASEIVPPKFIIKDIIPVGLSFMIAPPKSFKSTALLHWALKCLGKQNACALPEHLSKVTREGPVIMISPETSPGIVKFDAMFGLGVHVLERDPLYCQSDPMAFRLDNPDNVEELFYWFDRIEPSMVIFDPIRNLHSQDENDAGAMVAMMQPFQQYFVRKGIAGIGIHHTKKAPEKAKPDDMLRPDMARGTSALFGLADGLISQIVLSMDGDKPQMRMAATLKRGKPVDETYELNIEWETVKLETDIAAKIYNKILHEPCTNGDIGKHVGLLETEVLKYVNYMYKKHIIEKDGKRWEIAREYA